jgi:hypothetical protein
MIFLSGFSLWTAKAPVLILFIRLFGIQRWLRITAILTLVITGVAVVVGDAYNASKCAPPKTDQELDMAFIMGCTDASNHVGVSLGTIGIAADVVIFVLPLPIIAKLHIPLAKKIGLAIVFLAGLL